MSASFKPHYTKTCLWVGRKNKVKDFFRNTKTKQNASEDFIGFGLGLDVNDTSSDTIKDIFLGLVNFISTSPYKPAAF